MSRGRAGGGCAVLAIVLAGGLLGHAGEAYSQTKRPSLTGPIPTIAPAAPAPAPGGGGVSQIGALQGRAVARLPPLTDTLNTQFLQQLAAKPGKKCGEQEMAPGVWVRIDCKDYKPIAKAIPHYNIRKQKLLKAGQLRVTKSMKGRSFQQIVPGAAPGTPNVQGGERASGAPRGDEAPGKVRAEADDIPAVVDFRAGGGTGPVKDQGAVGSCTAFSLSSVIDAQLRKGGKQETVSPTHLWSHYGSPHMDMAFDANLGRGITTYESWPYSGRTACQLSREDDDECGGVYGVKPNTSDKDAKIQRDFATAEQSGKNKFISVERLDRNVDVDEVVQVLASGQPLWVAFKIDSDKWRNRNIQNGVIQDWSNWDGGHAVALMGYRKTQWGQRQFLVQNSWSERWADQGFAWVSENMVKKFMYHAYKVKLDPGALPAPAALTDEDCPWDKIVDFTLNKCADFCADEENFRPDNGQCGGTSAASKKK